MKSAEGRGVVRQNMIHKWKIPKATNIKNDKHKKEKHVEK